jgi:U3 small nucleolar RNA-associated protein 13
MAKDQHVPRRSYALKNTLETFYRGGPIAIDPTHSLLACANGDEVTLVDAKTGGVKSRTDGDTEPITALCFSANGKKVFVASRSLAMRELDVASGRFIGRKWKPHKMPVLAVSVDPSGQFLATASADRTIRVWDIERGYATHAFKGHGAMVTSVQFHETRGVLKLYSGSDCGEVGFWDLRGNKQDAPMAKDAHVSAVTAIGISTCGKKILSAGRDGVVRVFGMNGKVISTTNVGEAVEAARVLPRKSALYGKSGEDREEDGKVRFATVGSGGKVKLWKEGAGKAFLESKTLTGGVENNAKSNTDFQAASGTFVECRLAEDGEMLMAVTGDARALFFETTNGSGSKEKDTKSGKKSSRSRLTIARELIGDCDEIVGLAFARSSLEKTVYEDEIALIRDYNDPEDETNNGDNDEDDEDGDAKKRKSLNDANAGRETLPPPELLCAATSSSPLLRIFQAHKDRNAGFTCIAALAGHSEAILSVDCAPSKIVNYKEEEVAVSLAATGSKDHMVRLWNVERRECIAFGKGHVSAVTSVAFAPRKNAPFIVSGGQDRALRIWDVNAALESYAKANNAEENENDGENVVIRMPAIAATVAHDKPINGVAVSPNHLLVASASADRTAKLWKMPDLLCAGVCRGHKRGVWAIAFSDADKSVATAGGDKIIRLWDCSNTTGGDLPCLKSFESHSGAVLAVKFLSSGQQLASVGGDGKLLVWNNKNGLAVKEFEAHEDKAWAMARGGDGAYIATGGADGSLKLWEDDTLLASKHREDKMQLGIEKDQQLQDAEAIGNGSEALKLALKLERPTAFLRVASRMTMERGEKGMQIAKGVFKELDTEETVRLLKYIRDWNTNSKTSGVANKILKCVLTAKSLDTISSLPGIIDLCAGLKAYAIRHQNRAQRMYQSTFLIDTALTRMGSLREEHDLMLGMDEEEEEEIEEEEEEEIEEEEEEKRIATPPKPKPSTEPTNTRKKSRVWEAETAPPKKAKKEDELVKEKEKPATKPTPRKKSKSPSPAPPAEKPATRRSTRSQTPEVEAKETAAKEKEKEKAEPAKKKRGRPPAKSKSPPPEEEAAEPPKKKRGRPPKAPTTTTTTPTTETKKATPAAKKKAPASATKKKDATQPAVPVRRSLRSRSPTPDVS